MSGSFRSSVIASGRELLDQDKRRAAIQRDHALEPAFARDVEQRRRELRVVFDDQERRGRRAGGSRGRRSPAAARCAARPPFNPGRTLDRLA